MTFASKRRISGIPIDKSIKQGGKERPCLFTLMKRSVFRALQEKWKVLRVGVKTRNSVGRQEEDRVSHMIFADNCDLFAESKEQILKMIGDATEELNQRSLDWKEDQMELISWGFYEDVGDLHIEDGGKKHVIKEVETLQAMGALISKEADSTSALKFRMNTADKALWMDIQFYKNKGLAEGRKHKRYREVVQSCILHSCERLELEQGNGGYSARLGEQECGSHEFEKMGSNGAEFGMVPGQSDEESKSKIC